MCLCLCVRIRYFNFLVGFFTHNLQHRPAGRGQLLRNCFNQRQIRVDQRVEVDKEIDRWMQRGGGVVARLVQLACSISAALCVCVISQQKVASN